MRKFLPQTVRTASQELKIATIAQDLELLPDFCPHVFIGWIKRTKTGFEPINVLDRELPFADGVAAAHNVDQPTARSWFLVA